MEDVLDVYQLPHDPDQPVVCFDETSKQLVDHMQVPIAREPGQPIRVDDEYVRRGTANIFLAVEPLTGMTILQATEHRAAVDCANFLRILADEVFPNASTIRLVCDNLNTHTCACLYQAFPPEQARRLSRKFEIHHTPKHGSWLNIAECQLSVVARQCLDQRIASIHELSRSLQAWAGRRKPSPVHWHFTTDKARTKLRRLYPIISNATDY